MSTTATVEAFLKQVTPAVKAAAGIVDPPTSHVSDREDDKTTTPNEGAESKSDARELKNVFGDMGVAEGSSPADPTAPTKAPASEGGNYDGGLKKAPSGKDPASETASAKTTAAIIDPPTTFTAAKVAKFDYPPADPLEKLAATLAAHSNHLLAFFAVAPAPAAAAVEHKTAHQAGWDLAAATNGFDKQAANKLVEDHVYQMLKLGQDDAMAVFETLQGVVAGAEPTNPPPAAGRPAVVKRGQAHKVAGDDDDSDSDDGGSKKAPSGPPAEDKGGGGGGPPPGAGGPPPGAGGPPPGAGGPPPGLGDAGGGGGDPAGGGGTEDLIMALAQQLIVSPEDLMTALAQMHGGDAGGGGGDPGAGAGGPMVMPAGAGAGAGAGGPPPGPGMEVSAALKQAAIKQADTRKRANAVVQELLRRSRGQAA